MNLTQIILNKIKYEMKISHIVQKKPKNKIKLNSISQQDLTVDLQIIQKWSHNNLELYHSILENGMAQYLCNQEYLFEFYRHLQLNSLNIQVIDNRLNQFTNLQILDLTQNQIAIIQNIPQLCKQLYLDFNQIEDIDMKRQNHLEMVSLSHNLVTDSVLNKITKNLKELRCLNIAHNQIVDIRRLVTSVKLCPKLKILATFGNPISMLAIYYTYITEQIQLKYFDGQKYVKVQQIKIEPKVEEKKEPPKQEKKDNKKDNKKGAKVQQKIVEEPVKVQPPKIEKKKQLTDEDFTKIKINLKVSNLQQFSGNSYDISLFPQQNFDPKKAQSNFWLSCDLLNEHFESEQSKLSYDNTTIQNEQSRLNFDFSITKELNVSMNSLQQFNKGIIITINKQEPKMITDTQTLELKPELKQNNVQMFKSAVGAVFIDLRTLLFQNKKQIQLKYRLFQVEAVKQPLYANPFENEKQLINKYKDQLQNALKQLQQQKKKKAEQEQALKAQKKSGKDSKKGAQKKAAKKQGKDQVVVQKRKSQKCDFKIEERQYCYLGESKMYKAGKQLLCVSVSIN